MLDDNIPQLKNMSIDELNALCDELRNKIVDTVMKNGGHLSSNLGMVELTVALHYVFDFPKDKVIYDVGHQCYTHKLLTGRAGKFDTLRKYGGISGFPEGFPHVFFVQIRCHVHVSITAVSPELCHLYHSLYSI